MVRVVSYREAQAGWCDVELEVVIKNLGDADARNVKLRHIQIKQASEIRVNEGPDLLPMDQSCSVSILAEHISKSDEAIEVMGDLTWSIQRGSGALHSKSEIRKAFQSPWSERVWTHIDNPYQTGVPLKSHELCYVKRTNTMEQIEQVINDPNNNMVLLLHGLRRVGKTSLLNALEANPPLANDIPVLVDAESLSDETIKDGDFFYEVAREIKRSIKKQEIDIALELGDEQVWLDSPAKTVRRFFDDLEDKIGNYRILLIAR